MRISKLVVKGNTSITLYKNVIGGDYMVLTLIESEGKLVIDSVPYHKEVRDGNIVVECASWFNLKPHNVVISEICIDKGYNGKFKIAHSSILDTNFKIDHYGERNVILPTNRKMFNSVKVNLSGLDGSIRFTRTKIRSMRINHHGTDNIDGFIVLNSLNVFCDGGNVTGIVSHKSTVALNDNDNIATKII